MIVEFRKALLYSRSRAEPANAVSLTQHPIAQANTKSSL